MDTSSAPPNVMLAMGHPDSRHAPVASGGSGSSDTSAADSTSTTASTTPRQHQHQHHPSPPPPPPSRWACHKHVLAAHSPYFAAMFESEFSESDTSIVFLPSGVFSATGLDAAVKFMYAEDSDAAAAAAATAGLSALETAHQLLEAYSAADYLGMESLREQIVKRLDALAHQWTCYCDECRDVVIHVIPYSETRGRRHQDWAMGNMHSSAVAVLTSEPERALATFWTSPRLTEVLALYPELSSAVLGRINRFNAVETLYACFTAHVTDPALCITLDLARDHAVQLVAAHFGFYCSRYPALLSCIDGVKYSFDFVRYLFGWLLQPTMHVHHAPAIYQGIVRDLLSRHAVQQCLQVRTILLSARQSVETFIVDHLDELIAGGSLKQLDRGVLSRLMEERSIPIKRLGPLEPQTRPASATAPAAAARPRTSKPSLSDKPTTAPRRAATTMGQLLHRPVAHLFDWLRRPSPPPDMASKKQQQQQQQHDDDGDPDDKKQHPSTAPTDTKRRLSYKRLSPVGRRRILLVRKPVTSP